MLDKSFKNRFLLISFVLFLILRNSLILAGPKLQVDVLCVIQTT